MGPEVDRAFVVHGDEDQQPPFAEALRELGARDVHIPDLGETVEVK